MPSAAIARRQLAQLLNRQGRRHEAAEQIRELCRLGDVREDELHALLSLTDAIFDDPANSEGASLAHQPMYPIGPAAYARAAYAERKYLEAAKLMQGLVSQQTVPPAINAFYGRVLAESQDEANFRRWLATADESTKQYAEYWAGLGIYLVENQRFDEAVRALGEAVRRDSTDIRSFLRMNQALVALGKDEAAKQWFDRYVTTRDVTLASNRIGAQAEPDLNAFPEVIEGLEKLGRPLEATLWRLVQAFYLQAPKAEVTALHARRIELASSEDAFASESERLCGLDLNLYPLPDVKSVQTLEAASPIRTALKVDSLLQARFEDIAAKISLEHRYMVASREQNRQFSIYQSVGGGVAAFDFDLDGAVDLYLAQGGCDPPLFSGQQSNILYRSVDGLLVDTTTDSGVSEFRYTIGVTSGDWNQDGFPDLLVANLGRNALFVNNGDGTFSSQPSDSLDDSTLMSTSLAMADVTGDALPDIVELDYLHDSTIAKKPQINDRGEVSIVAPLDFKPAMDRVLVNDGMGGRKVVPISTSDNAKATGLGVVVSDFDGVVGNEIFVGNDVRPDQLWKQNSGVQGQSGWVDVASISGSALGSSGTPTASMGIAAGDFDSSGGLDLYITNFENEPAILLLNRGGVFQDRSIQFGLSLDSIPVLGFGCQSIDYSNDGYLDLVVTNGHVENTGLANSFYEQPAQLFANLGAKFQLMQVEDSSGYFSANHVGRGLATLDFNRDGKLDFVVTHIESPTALLLNQTETDNHWLKLRLVGTVSERDAIGGKVTVRTKDHQRTQWVIAGDGYLSHNEELVAFGLGGESKIDEIVVVWPSGKEQVFRDVATDECYLLVEGTSELFRLDYSDR